MLPAAWPLKTHQSHRRTEDRRSLLSQTQLHRVFALIYLRERCVVVVAVFSSQPPQQEPPSCPGAEHGARRWCRKQSGHGNVYVRSSKTTVSSSSVFHSRIPPAAAEFTSRLPQNAIYCDNQAERLSKEERKSTCLLAWLGLGLNYR